MRRALIILCVILQAGNLYALSDQEVRDAYYKSYQYEQTENYNDAIKSILIVYQEYPNTYTVNLRLGWLYYLNSNYANSLKRYADAGRIAPASLEAKLGHLLPLLAQQRYRDVEKEAFQILNIDYYNYYGNLRLAYALRMLKKHDTAEKIALKMLEIYPLDVSFLIEYALAKHGMGDVATAVESFHSVLTLDPENITAKGYLQTP